MHGNCYSSFKENIKYIFSSAHCDWLRHLTEVKIDTVLVSEPPHSKPEHCPLMAPHTCTVRYNKAMCADASSSTLTAERLSRKMSIGALCSDILAPITGSC